jgi:hypothetical protein
MGRVAACFNSSPNIYRKTKSRGMKWERYIARTGKWRSEHDVRAAKLEKMKLHDGRRTLN